MGQAAPLVAAVVVVVAVIGAALVSLAEETIVRSRAQAVADLVALAAAGDAGAGARVAVANGGAVESIRSLSAPGGGARVVVVVRLDGHRAVAAAER